ncbi:MAG: DUF3343 domain-containing protein [Clostridia bacterium]|nr:DUF3343 domain-containing protein [Clostridia bacterium]
MLATVASSTSANRLKRRLSEFGITSSVIQTPHILTKDGCGYSLRFDESSRMIVEKTATELGVKIRAFYIENTTDEKRVYEKM